MNLNDKSGEGVFYWLQIRPIVETKEMKSEDFAKIDTQSTILYTDHAIGHGKIHGVKSVVYVKTENFNSSKNPLIARQIEDINDEFVEKKEYYVLVGPGRWGSEDYFLGVPVKWPHISQARVIVESSLSNYRVEPSQGTHFFQNLTSFGVGYFTINPNIGDGRFDKELLDAMPADMETEYVRVVSFKDPLEIMINGTKGIGYVKAK